MGFFFSSCEAYLDHHRATTVSLTAVLTSGACSRTDKDIGNPLILTRIPGSFDISDLDNLAFANLYMLMHLLLEMMGSLTSLRTGEI